MATVEVVSATTAFPQEKIEEPIKAQETTHEEVVTAPEPAPEEPKETEIIAFPDAHVAPEGEASAVAEVEEAKVTPEELVVEKTEEETAEVVAGPVVEDTKETNDSTKVPILAPEPEPKSEAEVPKEEVTTEEEKPIEAEEKLATEEALAEKCEE